MPDMMKTKSMVDTRNGNKMNIMEFTVEEIKEEMISRNLPYVGMLATYCSGSDRYPFEVAEVSVSGKTIWLKPMEYRITEGSAFDGSAEYEYFSKPDGQVTLKATLRKDGRYRRTGCSNFGTVAIGHATAYRDPHF